MIFNFRKATTYDIPQMQIVRHSVKENVLSNPSLVTDEDYKTYILQRGCGWVCETNEQIVGFAIADLQDDNIWALFVLPKYEQKGIGKQLHQLMLDWYFSHSKERVWLSTAPGTRAEAFYIKQGWTKTGYLQSGEIKMEITAATWLQKSK